MHLNQQHHSYLYVKKKWLRFYQHVDHKFGFSVNEKIWMNVIMIKRDDNIDKCFKNLHFAVWLQRYGSIARWCERKMVCETSFKQATQ